MEKSGLNTMRRVASKRTKMLISLGLVLCVLVGGLAVAFSVIHTPPSKAHAAGITFASTTDLPWGVALDGSGNLWVAEPNCDGNPNCILQPGGTAIPAGLIAEYNASTMAKVADYVPPAPASYNPFLLTVNNGNVWFTDPTNGAIGEFTPPGTWNEWKLTATGAIPVDLVFDKNGNLWYTDFGTSAIGEFNTTTHTATETPTPTKGTAPYGIAVAPDGVTIWFTENKIDSVGSFTAASSPSITEHTFQGPAFTTPHLITVDKSGNAWFSTGFGGQIGEVAGTAANAPVNLYCVSNSVNNPHISGIGVDNTTGYVWFDDSQNARVGYLDPKTYNNDCNTPGSIAGVTYTVFSGSAHTHDGLVVDGSGNVYFTEEFAFEVGFIPAGTALPPPPTTYPPGPIARSWFFAEGRVGGNFEEFLTIGNPDPANQCIVDITYLLEQGNPVVVRRTIPPASRVTESVNNDLGTPATSATGKSVATIVQNDPISSCFGVVAERPMYFNYHGDQSGTDVMGATHTATNFYFADVPSGNGYSSYITILNPPGGQTATVTATYYANGQQVGVQTTTVAAGARGTIAPGALTNLPTHVAAVVTSTQPVVIERPTYFQNINGGIAGNVTGAASVIGAGSLQPEYYFAEGYAGQSPSGGATQENLVIANLDSSATKGTANVTISLEYINGAKHNFTVSVPSMSQVIWNVNVNGVGAASNEVSADVLSSGPGIVVSRELYFSYAHTLPRGRMTATGGTEVTGLPASLIGKSYTFAEGYSNVGYNEWLTLQNPTTTAETIVITMVNGYGRVYSVSVPVGASTRATIDITNLVLTKMVLPGDDHRGYEVSMTVQTLNGAKFVAERPMYFNTAGSAFPTVGGTDVIGYGGW